MLRLIHNQSGLGAILIDDIDDGLPNKTAHRLGTTADPHSYPRDGYANAAKQPCYIPYSNPNDATQPGFIDLDETSRVALSASQGKIAGFVRAGLITVISFAAGDLTAPAISGVTLNAPAAGDATIAGTDFLSLAPDVTSVHLVGAGVGDVTLTTAQIEAVAPGAVTDTSIVIDSTLIAGLTSGDDVIVTADGQASNTFNLP
jgi:Cu/Ag efflux protein CusF